MKRTKDDLFMFLTLNVLSERMNNKAEFFIKMFQRIGFDIIPNKKRTRLFQTLYNMKDTIFLYRSMRKFREWKLKENQICMDLTMIELTLDKLYDRIKEDTQNIPQRISVYEEKLEKVMIDFAICLIMRQYEDHLVNNVFHAIKTASRRFNLRIVQLGKGLPLEEARTLLSSKSEIINEIRKELKGITEEKVKNTPIPKEYR
jgi:hypothetical protein